MSVCRAEDQWRSRPWLAAVVRTLAVGVPVFAGWLAARWTSSAVSAWSSAGARVLGVLVVALLVSVLVSRVTSRFLPLAVLLRMTMLFPDKAPSRLKVARRTTSVADIKSRLSSPRMDEHDAATTMLALVTALGRHDRHTRGHSERVRLFCDLLSKELGLSVADSGRLRWAALIHDIGKLEIPVSVLNKPGKLDSREWDLIRAHPDAGARLASPLQSWLGPWFAGIAEHHEKYDGSGYPRGLSASAISTAGRAIAVVDAFETMTAARSYKSARSTLGARAELTKCAGSHFDPIMVRAFLGISLPRLLWSIGPLAFVVNLPYLQAVGQGGLRLGGAVSTTTAAATNAAGVTAVALAVSTAPHTAVPQALSVDRPATGHASKAHSTSHPGTTSASSRTSASPPSAPVTPQDRPKPTPGHPNPPKPKSPPAHPAHPKAGPKPPTPRPAKPGTAKPAKPAKPAPTKSPTAKRPTPAQLQAAWIAWWLAHHPGKDKPAGPPGGPPPPGHHLQG